MLNIMTVNLSLALILFYLLSNKLFAKEPNNSNSQYCINYGLEKLTPVQDWSDSKWNNKDTIFITKIGESNDNCRKVDSVIKFEGKAYKSDYSRIYTFAHCILDRKCGKVVFSGAAKNIPKKKIPKQTYKINKVEINQPTSLTDGYLGVYIEYSEGSQYLVEFQYSHNIIYKVKFGQLM